MIQTEIFKPEERVAFALRSLYRSFGYSQFRMSKFEEYDFYVRNKSFLVSDDIITFTDTNGKLMALKPDVTLSIVRNTKDGEEGVRKVYYHENVYRPARGSRVYREISQVGLECIGKLDDYALSEVLLLAERSLSEIAPRYALNLSHLGILNEMIRRAGYPEERHSDLFRMIGEKNLGELKLCTQQVGVSEEQAKPLFAVLAATGEIKPTLTLLRSLYGDKAWQAEVARLERVVGVLPAETVRLDFSVVGDRNYYNGIVFHGYVDGVPNRVLSGGQYDKLMQKLGKSSGAVGFAVYLDEIERFESPKGDFDVDTVVLYSADTDLSAVVQTMQSLTRAGKRAIAVRELPQTLVGRELIRL